MRSVVPILCLLLSLPASSTMAELTNVTVARPVPAGGATRLVLAQATYQAAMAGGDAVMLLAAIRLARGVTLRPPTGWSLTTTGEPAADLVVGRAAPVDPAAPQVLAIVQALASEDPSLQDLVFDLGAQVPHGRPTTAIAADSSLSGGQADTWRIALSGQVAAELGLIGDGDSPLALTVLDESADIVCSLPPGTDPGLCRFVPYRNGFFSVRVENHGDIQNSYRLIGG